LISIAAAACCCCLLLPTGLQIFNHFNLPFQFPSLLIVVLIPFYTNDTTTITLLPLLSHPLDDHLIVASAVSWQWVRTLDIFKYIASHAKV
jgi:hypothetical protein